GDQYRRLAAAGQRGEAAGGLVAGLLVLFAVRDRRDTGRGGRGGGGPGRPGGRAAAVAVVLAVPSPVALPPAFPPPEDAVRVVVQGAELVQAERRLQFDRAVDD